MAGGVRTRSSSERDDGADVGDSARAGGECLVETMRGREEPWEMMEGMLERKRQMHTKYSKLMICFVLYVLRRMGLVNEPARERLRSRCCRSWLGRVIRREEEEVA